MKKFFLLLLLVAGCRVTDPIAPQVAKSIYVDGAISPDEKTVIVNFSFNYEKEGNGKIPVMLGSSWIKSNPGYRNYCSMTQLICKSP